MEHNDICMWWHSGLQEDKGRWLIQTYWLLLWCQPVLARWRWLSVDEQDKLKGLSPVEANENGQKILEIQSISSLNLWQRLGIWTQGCGWSYQHQVHGGPRENGLMFASVGSPYLTCFRTIFTHFPTRNILVLATLNWAGQQVFNLSSLLQELLLYLEICWWCSLASLIPAAG